MVWWRVAPSMTNIAGPGASMTESGMGAPEAWPRCPRPAPWAHAESKEQNAIINSGRAVLVIGPAQRFIRLIDRTTMSAPRHRRSPDEHEPVVDGGQPAGKPSPRPPSR